MYKNLKEVRNYLYEINKGNYYIDYLLDEGSVSLEWYKALLQKVKEFNPKRVIDIGSSLNMFGYLFENEGIEYIGIELSLDGNMPIITDKIKMINDDYYNVREQFKDDIVISCLCVGYLIPYTDVKAKHLIVNELEGNGKEGSTICTARVIF